MYAYSWVKVGNFYLRSVITRGSINLFIIHRNDAGRLHALHSGVGDNQMGFRD